MLAIVCAVILSGCATSTSLLSGKQELGALQRKGGFQAAALLSEQRLGLKSPEDPVVPVKNGSLNHLEAADAWRLVGNYERAIAHYDAAEESIKMEQGEGAMKKAGDWMLAVVSNDTARGYQPTPVEGILTNLNKAVIFWSQGRHGLARVEFNRADERTRLAVERYAREIEAAQAEADRAGRDTSGAVAAVGSKMPSVANWAVYDDFINPAAAFLQAIFLLEHGDRSDLDRADALIRRIAAMEPGNAWLQELESDVQGHGNSCGPTPCTWLVVEYGLGPDFIERRFDVLLPIGREFKLVSMALPELVSRSNHASMDGVKVLAGGKPVKLQRLANMDRVVQTELSKRWRGIVTRAIVQATSKAVVQEQAADLGPLGWLASLFYTATSTAADTRILSTMPAGYAIAKLTPAQAADLSLPQGQAIGTAGRTASVIFTKVMPYATAKATYAILD